MIRKLHAITESHRPPREQGVFGCFFVRDGRRALALRRRLSLRNVAAARCSCSCTVIIVVGSDTVGSFCRRHRHCQVPSPLDRRQRQPAVPLDPSRRSMPDGIPKRYASIESPRRRSHAFEQAVVVDPSVAGL